MSTEQDTHEPTDQSQADQVNQQTSGDTTEQEQRASGDQGQGDVSEQWRAEKKKLLDELMGYKKQANETASRLKSIEMEKLEAEKNYQKIAELKAQEANEYRDKYEGLQTALTSTQKYEAVKTEALKSGILPSALEDLELIDFGDDVVLEKTSTGRVNVLGADRFVKDLKVKRPHWFGKSMGKNLNTGSPEVVEGKAITISQINKLKAQARKTGNWAAVEKANAQYKQQNQ